MRKLGLMTILFWLFFSVQAFAADPEPPIISLEGEQRAFTSGEVISFHIENAADLKIILVNEHGQRKLLDEETYTVTDWDLGGSYRAEFYQADMSKPFVTVEDLFEVKQLEDVAKDETAPSLKTIEITHDEDVLLTSVLHVSADLDDAESGVKQATLLVHSESNESEIEIIRNNYTGKFAAEIPLEKFQLGEKLTFQLQLVDFAENEIIVDLENTVQLYQPKAPILNYDGSDITNVQKKIGQVGKQIELTLDKYTTEFPELATETGKIIPLKWQKTATEWKGSLTLPSELSGEIIHIQGMDQHMLVRATSEPFGDVQLVNNAILTGTILPEFTLISNLYIEVNGQKFSVERADNRFISAEITTTGKIVLHWTDWDGQVYSKQMDQEIKPVIEMPGKEIIAPPPVIPNEKTQILTSPTPNPSVESHEDTPKKQVKKETSTKDKSSSIPFWIPALMIIGVIIFSGNRAMK
ncbi:hypothetical protein LVN26_000981 [Listeria monocytogenes]|nr:hypothetical protein [Listeria monocytogenes]EIQ6173085.1 hypothetical protein [Listeria monocytogenes]EIQ6204085.1 hypothetical protein [Listeria monocytogenes]EIQ6217425.1 hypothetical protein [Listeria monocytogenes]EIQ6469835.1 hypothetical protein [Listeria monocytogenes]